MAERACDECSECCRVLKIVETDKPPRVWCEHAKASCGGKGCAIYDTRPSVCRAYACAWKDPGPLEDILGPDARPDRLGMLVQVVQVGDGEAGIEAMIETDEPTPEQKAVLDAIVDRAEVVCLITPKGYRMLHSASGIGRLLRLHGAARVAAAGMPS